MKRRRPRSGSPAPPDSAAKRQKSGISAEKSTAVTVIIGRVGLPG